MGKSAPLATRKPATRLCWDCRRLDFVGPLGFRVDYEPEKLEDKALDCDLCKMFWDTCRRYKGDKGPLVRFERIRSSLVMNGSGPPVLSICCGPELKKANIQIGFPELPRPASPASLEIVRQWLWLCDKEHRQCRSLKKAEHLPTRLIDVGLDGDGQVRLWETGPKDSAEYIALSHPWGPPPHFVTDINNLHHYTTKGIEVNDLPTTFREAVVVTRALKRRYLWIDSICIVQGPGGDFQSEAKRMETVFSGAYCVLAASCARGNRDGFLQPRRERDYITLKSGSDPFYICENIDNFQGHVIEGRLSQRGWVLQEHALARRTIFFTEYQMYWECGDGVRCETLTKMNNNLAAFLGDPNFPQIIMSATKGEVIIRFQNLYRTYSGLALTNLQDRPIAINGIQKRLLKAFEARGDFGVFDVEQSGSGGGSGDGGDLIHGGLLRRSLLWRRASNERELSPITFPPHSTVPSWSWMAYEGRIDYLEPKFGKTDWEIVRSPWSMASSGRGSRYGAALTSERGGNNAIGGLLRSIIKYDSEAERLGRLYFDMPGGSVKPVTSKGGPQCLVLGVEQGEQLVGNRLHYFLLIAPKVHGSRDESKATYRRIGAGYLPGRYISPPEAEIRLL